MWDIIQLCGALALVFAVANRHWLYNVANSLLKRFKKAPDSSALAADGPADAEAARQAVIGLGRAAWDWDLDKLYETAWAIHEPNALAQLAEAYRNRDQAKIETLQKRLSSRLFQPEDKKPEDKKAKTNDASGNK